MIRLARVVIPGCPLGGQPFIDKFQKIVSAASYTPKSPAVSEPMEIRIVSPEYPEFATKASKPRHRDSKHEH